MVRVDESVSLKHTSSVALDVMNNFNFSPEWKMLIIELGIIEGSVGFIEIFLFEFPKICR